MSDSSVAGASCGREQAECVTLLAAWQAYMRAKGIQRPMEVETRTLDELREASPLAAPLEHP